MTFLSVDEVSKPFLGPLRGISVLLCMGDSVQLYNCGIMHLRSALNVRFNLCTRVDESCVSTLDLGTLFTRQCLSCARKHINSFSRTPSGEGSGVDSKPVWMPSAFSAQHLRHRRKIPQHLWSLQ